MARISNRIEIARQTAQANANFFGVPYAVFTDTSGYIQVERYLETAKYQWEIFYPARSAGQQEGKNNG